MPTTTRRGRRNGTSTPLWSGTRAARQCAGMRTQATRWLRQPIAGGMRAGIEIEQAAKWFTDTGRTPPVDASAMLREWFHAAYNFVPPPVAFSADIGSSSADTTVQAMPLAASWLSARAEQIDAARLLVASPAAVAIATAAAQAFTEADVHLLASTSRQLPYHHAHLLLSAPVLTARSLDEQTPDDVLAMTWWPDESAASDIRIVDWLATNGPVRVEGFEKARRTSARAGSEMPALYFHGERTLTAAALAPVDDDPIASEGQFTFDDPVYDPDWDFLPRFVLAIRHLIDTNTLGITTTKVMRPDSRATREKRVQVGVITTGDDDAHTASLLDPKVVTRIRRTRVDGVIRWQPPAVARQ